MSYHELLVITVGTAGLSVLSIASSVWMVRRYLRCNDLVNYAALVVTLTNAVLLSSTLYYSWRYWLPGITLG